MIRRILHNHYFMALLLIGIITLLAHGTFITRLGFYREDWYVVWVGDVLGSDQFIPLYQIDRPMMGYLYRFIYPILGHSPLPWHIYALCIRLIGVFSFFILLNFMWPEEKQATTIATILFAIYPGFLQQRQANSFQVHLTGLTLAIISLTLMIYSYRTQKPFSKYLTRMGAIVTTLIYPFLMEYYIGLEGLRAGILWFAIQKNNRLTIKNQFNKFFKQWWPYIFAVLVFLFWRLLIFESPRPTTDVNRLIFNYRTDLVYMLLRFVIELSKDLLEAGFLAWSVPLSRNFYGISVEESFLAGLVVLFAIGIFLRYLIVTKTKISEASQTNATRQEYKNMLALGVIGVLFALIPVVATNQNVQFIGRDDRFTLPASIGVALMITALTYLLILPHLRKWIFSILIGLSLVTHFNYGIHMKNYWEIQRQLWWQLSWRAPSLQPKTLLVVNLPEGYDPLEDHEIWSAANLIYYPNEGRPLITGEIVFSGLSYQIQWEEKKPMTYRGIWLNRHYEDALVASMPTKDSCLNVIDGNKYELSINEDPLVRIIAPFSNIHQIITSQSFQSPSTAIFGKEPTHSWCYYYQKSMYNRQLGNWEEVARLGSEALDQQLGPQDRSEWMPFFEAFVHIDNEELAQSLAKTIRSEYGSWQSICQQIENNPPKYPEEYASEKIFDLLCTEE